MKMKEVCEKSHLTEKAVRLYVKEGLLKPDITQTLHGNSYNFSEYNVQQLQDISTLRSAGFSLKDIAQMQQNPEKIPSMIAERQHLLKKEIDEKRQFYDAIDRLSISEKGNLSEAAARLRPAQTFKKDEKNGNCLLYFVAVGFLLVFLLEFLVRGDVFRYGLFSPEILLLFQLAGIILLFPLSILCFVMALRYGFCMRRAMKLPLQVRATIISVEKETGFDARFAWAGMEAGPGGREPGLGGPWQILFMCWNQLRPDHWFPLLQYIAIDGAVISASIPYGGLRRHFQEGEILEAGVDPREPQWCYPCNARWLAKKAAVYFFISILLFSAAVFCGIALMNSSLAAA